MAVVGCITVPCSFYPPSAIHTAPQSQVRYCSLPLLSIRTWRVLFSTLILFSRIRPHMPPPSSILTPPEPSLYRLPATTLLPFTPPPYYLPRPRLSPPHRCIPRLVYGQLNLPTPSSMVCTPARVSPQPCAHCHLRPPPSSTPPFETSLTRVRVRGYRAIGPQTEFDAQDAVRNDADATAVVRERVRADLGYLGVDVATTRISGSVPQSTAT